MSRLSRDALICERLLWAFADPRLDYERQVRNVCRVFAVPPSMIDPSLRTTLRERLRIWRYERRRRA